MEKSKDIKPKSSSRKKSSQKIKAVDVPVNLDYKKIELAKQLSREQIDMLVNIESFLEEYLDDFIIVGHAINGSRVNITHAKTPKDQDSLEQFYTDNLIFLKNKKMKDFL